MSTRAAVRPWARIERPAGWRMNSEGYSAATVLAPMIAERNGGREMDPIRLIAGDEDLIRNTLTELIPPRGVTS